MNESRWFPVVLLAVSAVIAVALMGILSVVAHDDPVSGVEEDLLATLRDGGPVLLFRHALTDTSVSDLDPTARGGCDQQRPLSEEGRRQAEDIGGRLRVLDIPIGPAFASPFCRTLETAELIVGTATPTDDLLSLTAALDNDGATAIAQDGAALIDQQLGGNDVAVLVSHTQNIAALTGREVEEGDAAVLVDVDGILTVLDVIPAEDW